MAAPKKPLHWVKRTRAAVAFLESGRTVPPYNRNPYRRYWPGNEDARTPWYGASFQLASQAHRLARGIRVGLPEFLAHYEPFFKQLVAQFDDGACWMVAQDTPGYPWWPNQEPTLPALRALFAQHRVPNAFHGVLRMPTRAVLAFARELLSYPTGVFRRERSLYSDVLVCHGTRPVVLQISHHLNVDFLSPDLALVRAVVQEHRSAEFTIKPYRGTSF
jgi:hypothetical protein